MKRDVPDRKAHEDITLAPELLTTSQAADLCGIGERTLWRWSHSGICPAPLKIGLGSRPAVRYRRAALVTWIESGCAPVDQRGDMLDA